jgi:hypothetical protein
VSARGEKLDYGVQTFLRAPEVSATVPRALMDNSPDEKPLRSVSFIVHVTRGVIRHQNNRRKAMFAMLALALLLLFGGLTFLAPFLNPREHLVWALLFWLACVWLTFTALLLAVFDLLIVRAHARKAERILREQIARDRAQNLQDTLRRE